MFKSIRKAINNTENGKFGYISKTTLTCLGNCCSAGLKIYHRDAYYSVCKRIIQCLMRLLQHKRITKNKTQHTQVQSKLLMHDLNLN